MKRRDFIGAIGAIGAAVGLSGLVKAQESFLEKLKRLGCTITHYEPRLNSRGETRYGVEISNPSGRACIAHGDSYRDAMLKHEKFAGDFFEGGGLQVTKIST